MEYGCEFMPAPALLLLLALPVAALLVAALLVAALRMQWLLQLLQPNHLQTQIH
jgi:hypothetical protein